MIGDFLLLFQNMDPATRERLSKLIKEAMVSGNIKEFLRARIERMFVAETWHLELLGIPSGASKSDVESAYRQLQKVVHPDCGGNERLFKLAQKAREKALSESV